MSIKNVKNKIIKTDEYWVFKIYINKHFNNLAFTAVLIIETHLIDNFKINMFIETDIITF